MCIKYTVNSSNINSNLFSLKLNKLNQFQFYCFLFFYSNGGGYNGSTAIFKALSIIAGINPKIFEEFYYFKGIS